MFTLQAARLARIWPIICELCSNRCPVGPPIAAWIPAVSQLVATQKTVLSPLSQFEQSMHIGRKILEKCVFSKNYLNFCLPLTDPCKEWLKKETLLKNWNPPSLEIPSSLSTGVEGGVYMGGGTLAATSNNGLVSCASAFSCHRNI